MSDAQTDAAQKPSPKKRSPTEKAIVWTVILVLIGLAGVEAQGRFGYSRTLKNLEDELSKVENQENPETLTLADFRQRLASGLFHTSTEPGEVYDKITVKWWSLKGYQMGLQVGKSDEQILYSYSTIDEFGDEIISSVRVPIDPELMPEGGSDPSAMLGGFGGGPGGPGVPGGPGGGGAGRPQRPGGAGGPDGGAGGPGGPGGGPGGPGGPGRGGRMGSQGLLGQLAQEGVRESLGLSAEELQKLDDAIAAGRPGREVFQQMRDMSEDERRQFFNDMQQKAEDALAGVLSDEQIESLRMGMIKRLGIESFTRDDVLAKLGLDDEQLAKAKEFANKMQADRGEAMRALGRDADPAERDAAMQKIRDEFQAALDQVLNDEQKAQLKSLISPE